MVSGTPKTDPALIISSVLKFRPHYIFATAWLFNMETLQFLLCRLKALLGPVRIILGGPEFLGNNEAFLRGNGFVDSVFKGEGEEIFPLLIRNIIEDSPQHSPEPWESLPGFEYLRPDGSYRKCAAVAVRDFPALVPPEKSRFFNWEKSFVQLETSRGCFNTCRFCVSGICNTPVRNIDPEIIRQRLKKIYRKGIREVRILDRTFNAQPLRAVRLLEVFRSFAGKIRFHIEIHPALINQTIKDTLSSLPEGLLHIEAGIQSLNDRVIEGCGRAGKTACAVEGLEYLVSLGKFEVHADLIAGLPGYTYKQLLMDANRLIGIGPHEIQLESLKVLPGTYFREKSRETGLIHSPVPPYEILNTKHITYDQLNRCMILSKILESWYNDPRWRKIFREIVLEYPDFLRELTEFLSGTGFLTRLYSFESKSELLYDYCKTRYPSVLGALSAGWVLNGLSLKKEPAAILRPWISRCPENASHYNPEEPECPLPDNPLSRKADGRYRYYYIIENENIHWFCFNKEIDRRRPVEYACLKYVRNH